jgi:hypothetical protein
VLYVTTHRLSSVWEEVHFVILAHYHLLAVKETSPTRVSLTPSFGDRVTVIGPLELNRASLHEIEAFAVHLHGLWWNDIHQASP